MQPIIIGKICPIDPFLEKKKKKKKKKKRRKKKSKNVVKHKKQGIILNYSYIAKGHPKFYPYDGKI
jgi:hypothetical protein